MTTELAFSTGLIPKPEGFVSTYTDSNSGETRTGQGDTPEGARENAQSKL